jgi:predicted amidohydrolase YtcJ
MAKAESIRCTCLNPGCKYLVDKLINDDLLSKLREGERNVSRQEPESILYTGGTIRPLKDGNANKIVEAIGFHDGRVVAAGTVREVTRQMDCLGKPYAKAKLSDGRTLLPGFIEPHVHIVSTAIFASSWNDFGPFEGQYLIKSYDIDYLKDQIVNAKDDIPNGFWILGYSVDPALMPFKINDDGYNILQGINVDTVDDIEKCIPILMMSASGHTAYVNTEALKLVYEENKHGFETFEEFREHVNAGGGLQEIEEIIPAFGAIPDKQLEASVFGIPKGLRAYFELAGRRGVTLLYDAGMDPRQKQVLDLYFKYFLHNQLKVRVGYALVCNSEGDANGLPDYVPLPSEFKNVYQGNIKIISDGSNQGLTGNQYDGTYRCEPEGNTGIFNFEMDEFKRMVKIVNDKKWPMMIHANGNLAIEKTLMAYESALDGKSGQSKRHRIEHCSLLTKDALQKMATLGISPSFLIGHVGYWGYVFDKGILEENAQLLVLSQSAVKKGLRISLHTDYFVSPLGPLRMMEQAITRIMEEDPVKGVLNKDEKLTPAQALRAVTYDAAWQCHADQWAGSLEAGKKADYVILAEDPVTRPDPVGMRDIPVLETWVDGVKVFNLRCK